MSAQILFSQCHMFGHSPVVHWTCGQVFVSCCGSHSKLKHPNVGSLSKKKMSILLHMRQGTSTRRALWTIHVKLRFPQLPGSGKANCDEPAGKCHCKGRKRQRKPHVADSGLSVGASLGHVRLRKSGLVAVQRMFKRHDQNPQWGSTHDPPPPVTLSPVVQHNPFQ